MYERLNLVKMLYNSKAPIKVQIELSRPACTGDCHQCAFHQRGKKPQLNLDRVKDIIKECCKAEIMRFCIAGPFLLSQLGKIESITKYVVAKGIITSLATCIAEEDFKEKGLVYTLYEMGIDKVEIYSRGMVNKELMSFLEKCNIMMIRPELRLLITDDNVKKAAEIAKGYKRRAKLSLSPIGLVLVRSRACTQLTSFIEQVKEIKRFLDVTVEPPLPPCKGIGEWGDFNTLCSAGLIWCSIDVEGNIYPCPMLRISLGNILINGFKEAWRRTTIYMRGISSTYEICQSCDINELCKGVCPAFSYQIYRDPSKGDPSLRSFIS